MKKVKDFKFGKWLFITWGSVFLILFLVNNKESSSNSKNDESKNTGCVGFGNENCQTQVINTIERQNKQVFNISYSNNGRFIVTVSDPKKMETIMTTITTDCNCQIIKVE